MAETEWLASRLRSNELCHYLGLVPDKLLPIVARVFDRRFGTDLGALNCTSLVAAFVNYPIDLSLDASN